MSLKHHTVGPDENYDHTHTVILLHGRDSDAEEFAGEFFESEASGPEDRDRTLSGLLPTVRWVFAAAPLLRSERFDTTAMSQWFDMWSAEDPEERAELQHEGAPGEHRDRARCSALRGDTRVDRDRIFLAGISQGFATALSALLADGRGRFAGLIGLCS